MTQYLHLDDQDLKSLIPDHLFLAFSSCPFAFSVDGISIQFALTKNLEIILNYCFALISIIQSIRKSNIYHITTWMNLKIIIQ